MVVARARPPSLTPLRRPGSKEDTRRLHQSKTKSTSRSHASMPQASSKAAAPSATGTSGGPRPPLRRGKWTFQEEAYVSRIIYDFNHGLLPLAAGTTLRAYLSDTLNCDPMRITKKFAGAACIGKRVFQPCDSHPETLERRRRAQAELEVLRKEFLRTTTSSMLSSSYHGGTSLVMPGLPPGHPGPPGQASHAPNHHWGGHHEHLHQEPAAGLPQPSGYGPPLPAPYAPPGYSYHPPASHPEGLSPPLSSHPSSSSSCGARTGDLPSYHYGNPSGSNVASNPHASWRSAHSQAPQMPGSHHSWGAPMHAPPPGPPPPPHDIIGGPALGPAVPMFGGSGRGSDPSQACGPGAQPPPSLGALRIHSGSGRSSSLGSNSSHGGSMGSEGSGSGSDDGEAGTRRGPAHRAPGMRVPVPGLPPYAVERCPTPTEGGQGKASNAFRSSKRTAEGEEKSEPGFDRKDMFIPSVQGRHQTAHEDYGRGPASVPPRRSLSTNNVALMQEASSAAASAAAAAAEEAGDDDHARLLSRYRHARSSSEPRDWFQGARTVHRQHQQAPHPHYQGEKGREGPTLGQAGSPLPANHNEGELLLDFLITVRRQHQEMAQSTSSSSKCGSGDDEDSPRTSRDGSSPSSALSSSCGDGNDSSGSSGSAEGGEGGARDWHAGRDAAYKTCSGNEEEEDGAVERKNVPSSRPRSQTGHHGGIPRSDSPARHGDGPVTAVSSNGASVEMSTEALGTASAPPLKKARSYESFRI
jgi:hypothetical protein